VSPLARRDAPSMSKKRLIPFTWIFMGLMTVDSFA
jgi:hypothetical protein